jgi:hypothetical protein
MAPHGVVAGPAILDLAGVGVLHSRSLGRGCPLRFGWSCASCVGADALTRGEWCALNGAAETRYWGSLGRLRLAGMFRIQGESSGRTRASPGTACFGRQLSPFPRMKGRQEQHSADRGSGSPNARGTGCGSFSPGSVDLEIGSISFGSHPTGHGCLGSGELASEFLTDPLHFWPSLAGVLAVHQCSALGSVHARMSCVKNTNPGI